MIAPSQALAAIPAGLRDPLLSEYQSIVQNFTERRWSPSELSGGKFCEIAYTVLDGFARKAYAAAPAKPSNFVDACRKLENHAGVPRSFQILIPRMLPALYEIRNNRGVGHVGGDVDPNHMDAQAVLSLSSWVMAELVRVFHAVPVEQAQQIVDGLVERRVPLVWSGADMKRVLAPRMKLPLQVLILLASSPAGASTTDLARWTDSKSPTQRSNLNRALRRLHSERKLELGADGDVVMLPPGHEIAAEVIAKAANPIPRRASKRKATRRR